MKNRAALALVALGAFPCVARGQAPAGPEFLVNTSTLQRQQEPSVAADASGNFVVVWSSYAYFPVRDNVFGQRFSGTGVRRGGEFLVNTYTTDGQQQAAVASAPGGSFVVVWVSDGQEGTFQGRGIFGQRFSATGAALGAEFHVNTYTTYNQYGPAVAADASGNFVVVWSSAQEGTTGRYGIFGQRFDAAGGPVGAEFRVNTYLPYLQVHPAVASDAVGNFVVVWTSVLQDGNNTGVFGQRFDATGAPVDAEFRVNTYTTGSQSRPSIASDPGGNFVVAWTGRGSAGLYGVSGQRFSASGAPVGAEFLVTSTDFGQRDPSVASDARGNFVVTWTSVNQDGDSFGVFGQRFSAAGAPLGGEFRVNAFTAGGQLDPSVALDAIGNFVVAWASEVEDGSGLGVFGQRFGGLLPAALAVDRASTATSDGNGVFDPGEEVVVEPSWRNANGLPLSVQGLATNFSGPIFGGQPTYGLIDAEANYGTVVNTATGSCAATSDCYALAISVPSTRPVLHWDAGFLETLSPATLGLQKSWRLHVGGSFTDVARGSGFYRFIETLLHHGVTSGCTPTQYCPATVTSREQMAVFVLVGKEGPAYAPPGCAAPGLFEDVPDSSPFCPWIEELAARGVVAGCAANRYCPADPVTREQMAVFVLRTLDPALQPPDCTPPNVFADVPESSPFCRWIEELYNRGAVGGCGGTPPLYCPTGPVTREQMSVFISVTFGLGLYGP